MYSNSMISNKFKLVISLTILIGLVFANPVHAQELPSEPATATKTAPVEAATAAVTEAAKDQTPAANLDPGMQIPVDGSSLEAFEKSLATIKEKATEANYTSLQGAIDYLLVYDIGAGRDKAKLAKNLDGLTGDQINEKVHWRQ